MHEIACFITLLHGDSHADDVDGVNKHVVIVNINGQNVNYVVSIWSWNG